MRRPIHFGDWIRRQDLPLHQPGTQAGQRGLPCSQTTERQVIRRHVVHPLLNYFHRQIRNSGLPPTLRAHESKKSPEDPASRLDTSFRPTSLLQLIQTKLFHQFR
jgi:hypothetical protein